jgi:hypothetical protein
MARAQSQFVYKPVPPTTVKEQSPAPYKGLNTVDSLAAMDRAYALSLQNFIANPQGCSPRQGYRKWATGFTSTVNSLITYNSKTSTGSKLFAVSGGNIYDITTGGAIGTAIVSGLSTTSTYWQQAKQTYSTSGSNYVMMVNGVDYPRLYDGTTWTTCSQPASPAGIGQFNQLDNNGNAVAISNFIDILQHQQRLWFVANNSTKAYYAPVAAVGGQLAAFDFGPLFTRGGSLYKLDTWTMDIGSTQGTQALLVAISSKGDVVVFAGNDPSSSTSWTLIGQYQVGSPVGRRCTTQYQGDLMILTQDGLYPLSKYLQSARLDSTAALTYTISPTISALTSSLASQPGFELCVFPSENVMMLNIPQLTTSANFQFCFHTITKGWSQFTGWPAACFNIFNDQMFFGSTDHVALTFIGYTDGADINGNGGNNISCTVLTAFDPMTDQMRPGTLKTVRLVKPFLTTGMANPMIAIGVNTDFNLTPIVGTNAVYSVVGGVWDNMNWDAGATTWQGSLTTYNQWSTPNCYPGEYLAFAMSLSVTADTIWSSTSWIISPGGEVG